MVTRLVARVDVTRTAFRVARYEEKVKNGATDQTQRRQRTATTFRDGEKKESHSNRSANENRTLFFPLFFSSSLQTGKLGWKKNR